MATNYPSSLDTSSQQPSPSSTTDLDASGYEHDVVHTNHSGAIIALETKLGTGDSNAVADAVLMGTGSGTSAWDTSPTFKGAVTVGVDGTGHDVKFFSDTAGDYFLWDESEGQVIIESTGDAAVGSASGILRIGAIAGSHLAIDGNEIMAKSDATTAGTLYLQNDGGKVKFGNNTDLSDFEIHSAECIIIGKVGINTTAPETDLHITNSSTLARIHIDGSSTGYTQSDVRLDTSDSHRGAGVYAFNSDSDVTWFWGNVYNAGDTWGICRKTGSAMQQSAADSGNLMFQIGSNGAAYNVTGTWGTISDERLKSDITTARQYTADLAKLRVVNYSLTQRAEMNEETGEVKIIALEEPSEKLLGLVAQEVEKVFPAMVDTRADGMKSVKTSVLVPMMLTAIQELTTRIEALEGA